jgi:hypothetical protein
MQQRGPAYRSSSADEHMRVAVAVARSRGSHDLVSKPLFLVTH